MQRETPVIVPPVPTPDARISIAPSLSFRPGGCLVDRRIRRVAESLQQHINGPVRRRLSVPRATAPDIPRTPSVNMSLATYARRSMRHSRLMISGIVKVKGILRVAAMNARAIPVLPLVGSISFPERNRPRFSASPTIAAPTRHLTEYDGLRPSIFARIVAEIPAVTWLSRTNGVRPTDRELSSNQCGIWGLPRPKMACASEGLIACEGRPIPW